MNITFYQRKPHPNHFSIEKVFQGVREHLPENVRSRVAISRFFSTGFFKRLYNALEAQHRQGNVNHITGDVHYLTVFLKKKKTVLTIHDCGFMNHSSLVARIILLWFWLKIPVWRSGVVTVISEATKKDIIKYTNCPADKIKVIPDFVSPAYRPAPLPNNPIPVLLQIGTKANKNIARLAQALEGANVQLRIIGKPTDQTEEMLIKHKIDYSWVSHLSENELIREYAQCDALVFVSTLEGFGMPIVEAQAIGRPVITSAVSAMPEVAGEGACLVDPFDVSMIREGIDQVLKDESYRNSLVQKGFINVQQYQVKQVADQYHQLYRQLFCG